MPPVTKLAVTKGLVVPAVAQELCRIIQKSSKFIVRDPTLLLHLLPIAIESLVQVNYEIVDVFGLGRYLAQDYASTRKTRTLKSVSW
jgi:hypothetical protein